MLQCTHIVFSLHVYLRRVCAAKLCQAIGTSPLIMYNLHPMYGTLATFDLAMQGGSFNCRLIPHYTWIMLMAVPEIPIVCEWSLYLKSCQIEKDKTISGFVPPNHVSHHPPAHSAPADRSLPQQPTHRCSDAELNAHTAFCRDPTAKQRRLGYSSKQLKHETARYIAAHLKHGRGEGHENEPIGTFREQALQNVRLTMLCTLSLRQLPSFAVWWQGVMQLTHALPYGL